MTTPMSKFARVFYFLFKRFPSIEEAASEASRTIYDEYLDSKPPYTSPSSPSYTIVHDDRHDPEEGIEG